MFGHFLKLLFSTLFIFEALYYGMEATSALPPFINIGAIFQQDDRHLSNALHEILDRINNDRKILPRTNLTVQLIDPIDTFKAAKSVCQMFNSKIWLLLTSRSDSVNWFARSTADMLHIPHLSVQWDYRSAYLDNVNFPYQGKMDTSASNIRHGDPSSMLVRGHNGGYYMDSTVSGNAETGFRMQQQSRHVSSVPKLNHVAMSGYNEKQQREIYSQIKHLSLNVYPDATELSEALKDFIDTRNWKSFTLIYDSNEALIKCKDLLTLANKPKPGKPKMKISVLNFTEFQQMARKQETVFARQKRRRQTRRIDQQQTISSKPSEQSNSRDSTYYHRNRYRPYGSQEQQSNWHPYQYANQTDDQHLYPYDHVFTKLWKEIKPSEHNFVLSVRQDRVINILKEAMKTQRMSEYDNYFIVTMDLHTFDLSEFQFLEPLPNITSLSLLSSHGQEINFGDNGDQYYGRPGFYGSPYAPVTVSMPINKKLSTNQALIYDSMTLFARALDDLDRSKPELIVEPFVACDFDGISGIDQRPWPVGIHLIDFMKNARVQGVTGPLLFNDHGLRVNFTLDVLQLKNDGLKNVAKWTRAFGIKSVENYTFFDSYKAILEAMKFKEFLITAVSSIPYVFLKEDHEKYIGNDKYEGYCIDLLEEIAKVFRQDFQSDFKYIIQMNPDGQYGRPDKETGEWNGMFGQLIRHQADLAIADLTATYLRETAVDFTMPFMNLGITILFKKPSAPEPEMFSFLKPFSVEVWLYLASAFLGVSLLLWIMSRISPYEWQAPHSCDPDPMELCNQFSIGNSLWFTIGSLMQQGSDLAPRALSTRTLATIWWFFTLIIISSYTANLAASLTLSRMAPAISSVEDLAKQTSILYGCRKGGSTHEFFANSNNSIYQRMYNTMEANPEVYINKISDAIERVRKGGYAYLAESSTIEYLIQRRCDLIQVGNWLDNKGYGIATPPDSPYRTPISNAITVLQDRGILYTLKKRWWVDKGGGLCTEDTKVTSASELEIENVGGVFLVLAMGVAIGIFSGFIEFIWKALKIAPDERESIGKLIWLEMFRICTGGGSSRPVKFHASPSAISMTALDNGQGQDEDSGSQQRSIRQGCKRTPFTKTSSFNSMAQFDNNSYYLPPPVDEDGTVASAAAALSMDYYERPINMRPINGKRTNTNTTCHSKDSMGNDSNAPLLLMSSTKSLNKLNINPELEHKQKNSFGSPNSFKSQQPYHMY